MKVKSASEDFVNCLANPELDLGDCIESGIDLFINLFLFHRTFHWWKQQKKPFRRTSSTQAVPPTLSTQLLLTRRLPGLMSRCRMPAEWRYFSPSGGDGGGGRNDITYHLWNTTTFHAQELKRLLTYSILIRHCCFCREYDHVVFLNTTVM